MDEASGWKGKQVELIVRAAGLPLTVALLLPVDWYFRLLAGVLLFLLLLRLVGRNPRKVATAVDWFLAWEPPRPQLGLATLAILLILGAGLVAGLLGGSGAELALPVATAALVAASLTALELAARYRRVPWRVWPTWTLRLLTDAAVGAATILTIRWAIDESLLSDSVVGWVAAGILGPTLLRTRLFVVAVGDKDVPIGPAGVTAALSATLDRAVDREAARVRLPPLDEAARRLAGVPPEALAEIVRVELLGHDYESRRPQERALILGAIDDVIARRELSDHERRVLLLFVAWRWGGDAALDAVLQRSD